MNLLLRLRQRVAQGIRHRVTLLGAMILSLLFASGMLAFTTSQNAFFLLFSLLLAALLVSSFVNRLMLAELSAELRFPSHPMAATQLDAQLVLRNHKSALTSFALEIEIPSYPRIFLPAIPPNSQVASPLPLHFPRRGWAPPLEMSLYTRFPFGFSIRRTRLRVPLPAPLYPSIEPAPGQEEILDSLLRQLRRDSFSGAEEFSHLREYAHGDPARLIAWAPSARMPDFRHPLLRVSFAESGTRLRLVLDLATPFFEEAVQLAAFLVWQLHFKNLAFVFSAASQDFAVSSASDAYTVLKHLALVDPLPGASIPQYASAFLLSYRPGFLPPPVPPVPPNAHPSLSSPAENHAHRL